MAPNAVKPNVVTLSMHVWFSHGMSYIKTFVLMCCIKCNNKPIQLFAYLTVAVPRWGRGGHRPLKIVYRPPKLAGPQTVARPPNLAVLLTLWSIDSQKN